jgi:hypothetical protein
MQSLQDTGNTTEHKGYPPHAAGGEAMTLDPDGNTILLGQRNRSTTMPAPMPDDPAQRFSLLREAAALSRRYADATVACQVGNRGSVACGRPAEVKLADGWGDTAWACLPHADEALVNARGAFIASQDDDGLAAFLAARQPR